MGVADPQPSHARKGHVSPTSTKGGPEGPPSQRDVVGRLGPDFPSPQDQNSNRKPSCTARGSSVAMMRLYCVPLTMLKFDTGLPLVRL